MPDSDAENPEQTTFDTLAKDIPELMLTYQDVAKIFVVTVQTVMMWVKEGKFPPPTYFGNLARWMPEVVHQVQLAGIPPKATYQRVVSPKAKSVSKSMRTIAAINSKRAKAEKVALKKRPPAKRRGKT